MARQDSRDVVQHAMTIDVEDWFEGIPISQARKARAEARLMIGMERLLALLERHGVRATFFVLGTVASAYPRLIRGLVDQGHEVGCHGWSHQPVYTMSPARFSRETQRATDAIGELIGERPVSYRAAFFSIVRGCGWALEELVRQGYACDSSIFPVRNWRYGVPDFAPRPQWLNTPAGRLWEVPMSVRSVFGQRVPVSGGAYFRLYPYALTRANFLAMERRGQAVNFYLHPWELDPGHPRVAFDGRAWLTHYANLSGTLGRLDRLLGEFRFGPLRDTLGSCQDRVEEGRWLV